MRKRVGTVLATLVFTVAATAVAAGAAGPASASSCVSGYGLRQDSGANFWQEVSFELCAGPSLQLPVLTEVVQGR